ncbi:MAG: TolC family protein [Ignavibacteriae bacterium]|nr:TolC family protein [Ignavibacteriota bacterium]
MYFRITTVLCLCLIVSGLMGQSNDIINKVQLFEKNNIELKSLLKDIKSKEYSLSSTNNYNDPELESYYLPYGNNSVGDYLELQLSQSFEFPLVYSSRNILLDVKHDELSMLYKVRRQEILLHIYNMLLDIIHLNKMIIIENNRQEKAKIILEQSNILFEKEQIGILEFNKSKVKWLQHKFKIQQLEREKQKLISLITSLNGNQELEFVIENLNTNFEIETIEVLWENKIKMDPTFKILLLKENIAQAELNLNRNSWFPDLKIGANYQGFSGNSNYGFYGGISIPLWNNSNNVESSEYKLEYNKMNTLVQTQKEQVSYMNNYNYYISVLKEYDEYRNTLGNINSSELLFKAYSSGELSFNEYYLELEFYHNAQNKMLEMENELNHFKAELLKHQL